MCFRKKLFVLPCRKKRSLTRNAGVFTKIFGKLTRNVRGFWRLTFSMPSDFLRRHGVRKWRLVLHWIRRPEWRRLGSGSGRRYGFFMRSASSGKNSFWRSHRKGRSVRPPVWLRKKEDRVLRPPKNVPLMPKRSRPPHVLTKMDFLSGSWNPCGKIWNFSFCLPASSRR